MDGHLAYGQRIHRRPSHIGPGPASTCDPYATVLALELDGELDLYRGQGEG
ncbi:hypothetical protein OHB49_04610 [Streptomyces sp. NBC_01717]|uniref:hypothetical protein n=1 Tax=Streptomyces sp. NBC_01717 TaxID=2975918 RepID=UPI002E31EDA2|nr:hypothetical protein [Streptomyces sp. NBC_01717]